MDLLDALVRQLASELRAEGIPLLVIFADDHPLYSLQMDALSSQGIPFLDFSTPSLATLRNVEPAEVYFQRHPHWNPASHETVAEAVAERLNTLVNEDIGGN